MMTLTFGGEGDVLSGSDSGTGDGDGDEGDTASFSLLEIEK